MGAEATGNVLILGLDAACADFCAFSDVSTCVHIYVYAHTYVYIFSFIVKKIVNETLMILVPHSGE